MVARYLLISTAVSPQLYERLELVDEIQGECAKSEVDEEKLDYYTRIQK